MPERWPTSGTPSYAMRTGPPPRCAGSVRQRPTAWQSARGWTTVGPCLAWDLGRDREENLGPPPGAVVVSGLRARHGRARLQGPLSRLRPRRRLGRPEPRRPDPDLHADLFPRDARAPAQRPRHARLQPLPVRGGVHLELLRRGPGGEPDRVP